MTKVISNLSELAGLFDTVVLDQWGVLHDGTAPYPGAVAAVAALKPMGFQVAVLSNSGKRSALNARRIAEFGFDTSDFDVVMTSGEALWRDIDTGTVSSHLFFPIEREEGDATTFLEGLDATATHSLDKADAVLLMGVPDDAAEGTFDDVLAAARKGGLPVICTNPDRASPRSGGRTVTSPGALAHAHAKAGGDVRFYGKPHLPVFRAVEAALGASRRIVMVGDSLEHDIAGAQSAGWSSLFVSGGLHAEAFGTGDDRSALARLAKSYDTALPDYMIPSIGGDDV